MKAISAVTGGSSVSVISPDVQSLFRQATACSYCFRGGDLKRAIVDIAQPRWLGPSYWIADPKVLIVLINPASGEADHKEANERFSAAIKKFSNRASEIGPVFAHQRHEIPSWG